MDFATDTARPDGSQARSRRHRHTPRQRTARFSRVCGGRSGGRPRELRGPAGEAGASTYAGDEWSCQRPIGRSADTDEKVERPGIGFANGRARRHVPGGHPQKCAVWNLWRRGTPGGARVLGGADRIGIIWRSPAGRGRLGLAGATLPGVGRGLRRGRVVAALGPVNGAEAKRQVRDLIPREISRQQRNRLDGIAGFGR